MIKLPIDLFNQIVNYCRQQLPSEACGALLGSKDYDTLTIQAFRPVTNIASSSKSQFEFDRNQLLSLVYNTNKPDWIGIFHSHPLTPAYPSELDLINYWDIPIYAIFSFQQPGTPALKMFRITTKQQKKTYSIIEHTIEII